MSTALPPLMTAIQLLGHGGPDQLVLNPAVPTPQPGPGEVTIRVHAAGINNTDINTRIGWYAGADPDKGDWTGAGLAFPRIQGADVCGRIVATGADVDAGRIGARVIVQSCLVSLGTPELTPWLGSERDGGFAQFVAAPAADTHAVDSELSDAELAAIPCAYGTAETLLTRAQVGPGARVLITGASGNVGLAAIQLARLRGAEVIAVAAPAKFAALRALGAGQCLARGAPLDLAPRSLDAVIDVVGGPDWAVLPGLMRPGGRIAVSGAIAGAVVALDLRQLYLGDLTLIGSTRQSAAGFKALLDYLARGVLRPQVAAQYPLAEIAAAQAAFESKAQIGKIVLIPPPLGA